jgi:hypothetical protein
MVLKMLGQVCGAACESLKSVWLAMHGMTLMVAASDLSRGAPSMSATIELYKAVGHGPNLRLGPYVNVEIRHRRLIGNGVLVALRHTDGLWRQPAAPGVAFLAARVSTDGSADAKLRFVKGWKPGSDLQRLVREVRLQGDHLYLGSQATPFAHTVDESRIWQTWADGLAFEAATIAAG